MDLSGFDFGRDYFELFGQPRLFAIDPTALDTRYRELQGLYHPDRHAGGEARDRRLAVQASAWVNEGYQTLRDPARRARYLLELAGVSFDDERDTTSDTDFLMRQLELRETLEATADAENPLAALEVLMSGLREDCELLFEHFNEAYTVGELDDAKRAVLQLRFYARLLNEADQMAERLEDQDA
ncbi:Fe-S protein assembly co-chaperone HscB [Acidihalobacter yilgarnensis]|uniref:Co-chaperone protein HscB homolog n=1 Tax=Acidihalobacter yilgarnensis TaxID=2819280 RepID=A0A1D8IP16_9GAMM|nr:Fe-S protein assembly co-chaperone HscB [Acidihalobacter yilgarnensis]AOU98223.1 Fe-S protein assembly co-chaperone HscB [Acidihalobacter yilgarnensis]